MIKVRFCSSRLGLIFTCLLAGTITACMPKDVSHQRTFKAAPKYDFQAQDLSLMHAEYLQYRMKDVLDSVGELIKVSGARPVDVMAKRASGCLKTETIYDRPEEMLLALINQNCEIDKKIKIEDPSGGKGVKLKLSGQAEARVVRGSKEGWPQAVLISANQLRWQGRQVGSGSRFGVNEKRRSIVAKWIEGDGVYRIQAEILADESQYFRKGDLQIDMNSKEHTVEMSLLASWNGEAWVQVEVEEISVVRDLLGVVKKKARRKTEREEVPLYEKVELSLSSSEPLRPSSPECGMWLGKLQVQTEVGMRRDNKAKTKEVDTVTLNEGSLVIDATQSATPWYHCTGVNQESGWNKGVEAEIPVQIPVWNLFWR